MNAAAKKSSSFDISQVNAFRLARHALVRRKHPDHLIETIGRICGLQAQIPAAAEQAAAVRAEELFSGTINVALEIDKTLARTWLMRGTVHIVPSSDLPLFIAAIGPASIRELQRWLGKSGVTSAEIGRASEAVCRALEGGESLTRGELADRVVEIIGKDARRWIDHGWGGIVKQAAFEGVICFGPTLGRKITFVQTEKWLGNTQRGNQPNGAEARRMLLVRYLGAYGPATIEGFARWAGLFANEAREALRDAADEIVAVTVGGERRITCQSDMDAIASSTPSDGVVLLPAFDPLILGCMNKHDLIDPTHEREVFRKAGWIAPTVLIGGRVRGTWNTAIRVKTLSIQITQFDTGVLAHAKAIGEAAETLGSMAGRSITIAFI